MTNYVAVAKKAKDEILSLRAINADLLEACQSVHDQLMADFRHGKLPIDFRQYTLALANELHLAIRKAEETQ